MSHYQDLEEAVLNGQDEAAALLVHKLVSNKPDPAQIIESISGGLFRASENWTNGSYSSANILLSIDAYREAKEILNKSNLFSNGKSLGRIIIANVAGNMHILGKALAGALLEAAGFEVIDLGENTARGVLKERGILEAKRMMDFKKEHLLLIEALKFSEEEFSAVCKTVDDQQLFTLLEAITNARNIILDAMMARTMERKPNPLRWNAADNAAYVVKTIEDELKNRMKKEEPSEN